MPVNVKFFSMLRARAECDGVEIEAKTVGEAAKVLERKFAAYIDFVKLLGSSNAVLNGENVTFLDGPRTKLKDGDELIFFPPLGGG
jgi:molybdopterin converting factor small subunit